MPRILCFAGSTRTASLNKKLARAAAALATEHGAEASLLDLRELELPLFDEDLETEHGLPAGAVRFKQELVEHDGILIACPEYNSSITAVLKNAIDWASRQSAGEKPLAAFRGKVAGLVAASPGALGGLRGLVTVRSILGNIGVFVTPTQLAVPKAHEVFDTSGALSDTGVSSRLDAVVAELVSTADKLSCRPASER
jgi:NAD(P)H-dependent FMN reductase